MINGENRIQDKKRGEGDKAILNKLKKAGFPETLDPIRKLIIACTDIVWKITRDIVVIGIMLRLERG